jgi:hypothetical protein
MIKKSQKKQVLFTMFFSAWRIILDRAFAQSSFLLSLSPRRGERVRVRGGKSFSDEYILFPFSTFAPRNGIRL